MAIALVQHSSSIATGTTSATATLPAASTAGNLLVAFVVDNYGALNTLPSGWTNSPGEVTGSVEVSICYYANNPGSLSSFAFGANGGTAFNAYIAEFSGVAASSPVDTYSTTGQSATSPLTATTIASVAGSGELVVGVVGDALTKAGTTTIAESSGLTDLANNGSSSVSSHLLASYLIGPTSGSTFSETGSTSSSRLLEMGVHLVVFKLPSGGALPFRILNQAVKRASEW